jgi:hypothetical protein
MDGHKLVWRLDGCRKGEGRGVEEEKDQPCWNNVLYNVDTIYKMRQMRKMIRNETTHTNMK